LTLHANQFRIDTVSFLKEGCMEGEIWKDVPGMDGIKASTMGRVLFPACTAEMPKGGIREYKTKPVYGVKRKSIKGAKHTYLAVVYRGKNLKIHRLVCAAFHGIAPSEKAVVIHLDEDGTNNRPDNLKWGTQKENMNAAGFIAYCKGRTGENSPAVKGREKKECKTHFGS
jgi:hypothetical protein